MAWSPVAGSPAPCRTARRSRPDRSGSCAPGPGYGWPRASGGSRVRRRWRCTPASRTRPAHGLRREIVDLVRPRLLNDADDLGCVGDVAVMQMERDPLLVGIINEMVDAFRVERRGTTLHAVNQIALRKKKCREVGAILPGHAGDERHLARPSCHYGSRGTYLQSTAGT